MSNLVKLRQQKNASQAEVAKILNVTQASYNRYESGINEPNIEKLIKLADFYNVSLDYLVGREYSNSLGFLNEFDTATVQNFLQLNEKNKMQASSYIAGLLFAQ